MPTHSLKARALLLCLALFLAPTAAAHAGGQAEPRLADAEKLFQQQEYAEALKMLVAIQRMDPNLKDETGRLIAQIMAVTQHFNQVLEELNTAIEAADVEKMETLVVELQHIDPVRARGIADRIQVLAGIIRLMIRALALLQAGKTTEALSLYLLALTDPAKAGVTLPLSQFEAAGYGEIITASVRRITADIVSTTQKEVKAAPDIPAVLPAVKELLTRGTASAAGSNQTPASQLDALTAPLLQAAAAEGLIRARAATLADFNNTIKQGSGKGMGDLLLRYLLWICLGRASQHEGIAFGLRLLWADEGQAVAEAAGDNVISAFESARSQYETGALAAADGAFQDIPPRSILAAKAAALVSARFDVSPPAGSRLSDSDSSALNDVLGRTLAAQEYAAETAGYRLLISLKRELAAMPAVAAQPGVPGVGGVPESPAAEQGMLVSARANLDARASEARVQEQQWTAVGRSWEGKEGVVEGVAPLAASALHLASLFGSIADTDIQSRDLAYALRLATLGGATFPQRLESAEALRAKAEDLKDGTTNGQVPPGTGLPVKHPDQALQLFATAGGSLDSLTADVVAQEQKLEAEKDYVKASPAYSALLAGNEKQPGYNTILQTAQTEKAKIDTLVAASQRQIDTAALLSREGDNAYAQALAALSRNDPELAQQSLDTATDKYLQSLAEAYTEHAEARTTTDVADLNNRIVSLRTTLAVTRAKKDIVDINKLVVAEEFLRASDALDDAERRWTQSGQPNNYPPFDLLRQGIQTAVELNQGREISRVDPKADVVNTLIKNAQDNLFSGKLAEAAQNVKDALAVAPNYGTAKVLALKIRKQTDPAGFQRDALAQIAFYSKMVDSTNRRDQQTAYNALQDYSKLDPQFATPKTRATILELKYALNPSLRPPSAQQIAQSHALFQRANAIQQQGTPESYQSALDLLQQAYKLNPDPQGEVVTLDALIREKLGSTAIAALSPADTREYNLAYSMFLSGAYQDAYDKVMSIWNDPRSPRNRTYGPLQRLKKRLEVQLNIS